MNMSGLKEWQEQHDALLYGYTTLERIREIYGNNVADRVKEEVDKRELQRYRICQAAGYEQSDHTKEWLKTYKR